MRRLLSITLESVDVEKTPDVFESLALESEFVDITHAVSIEDARYESLCDAAASLESLRDLAEQNPQSLESLTIPFSVVSAGHLNGNLSLEGIGNFLKSVWDAIVKAWNKLKDMVMKLINWITGRGGKSQKSQIDDAYKKLRSDGDVLEIKASESSKRVRDSMQEYNKGLAAREEYYQNVIKASKSKANFLDELPTNSREDFDKFVLDDSVTNKVVSIKAKSHAKETMEAVDATKETAEQYEKTIKARDELVGVIEKKLKDVPDGEQNAMANALRNLQKGPEVGAAKSLNAAAKKNAKAVKTVAAFVTHKERLEKEQKEAKSRASDLATGKEVYKYITNDGQDTDVDESLYLVYDLRKDPSTKKPAIVEVSKVTGSITSVYTNGGRKSRDGVGSDAELFEIMFPHIQYLNIDMATGNVNMQDAMSATKSNSGFDGEATTAISGSLNNQSPFKHLIRIEEVHLSKLSSY